MYIEKYHYNLEFDPVTYFSQFKPGVDYEPSWPLITVSCSRLTASANKDFWTGLLAGKKRERPSVLIQSNIESIPNAISKVLGVSGPTFSLSSACTSGAYALYQAIALSKMYGTPVIVAVADNIIGSSDLIYFFSSLGALSLDTGIPFDQNSKGFRPGRGQGFFVVSDKPLSPLANISTMRFFTQPEEYASVGSIENIKKEMFNNLDVSRVSWWNAHAPGTPTGDRAEYELFSNLQKDIPISSIKGVTGHLLASSFLVELGVALDSVAQGLAKGNVAIATPINSDDRIIKTDVKMDTKTFLKFNMGFGGKNVLTIVDSLV